MDQLKTFLTALKKYHFWVLCGIVLITTLACWWMATATLAEQYHQSRSTIEEKFNAFTKLGTNPPNEAVINKIAEQETTLKKNVYGAWEELYHQQEGLNPVPKELGDEFKRNFENLKPNQELDLKSREVYQNFIKNHFPTLPELVDARRPAPISSDQPSAPSPDTGPNGGEQFIGVVEWNDGERKIANRFEWAETPSTADILLAQEDLWVYEALLRVIKNTNKDATNPSNAVVRAIDTIAIGKDAIAAWKSSEELVVRGTEAMVPGAPTRGAPAPGPRTAIAPTAAEPASGIGEPNQTQAAEERYVDSNGQPLPPLTKGPHEEFKMMPIFLSLLIDQRQVPKLLVECANSKMPIEVLRIQLKAEPSQPLDISAMADAGVVGRQNPKGGRGVSSCATSPRGGGNPRTTTGAEGQTSPYDIPVDICGVLFIYNPPDPQVLATGPGPTGQPAAATVPGGTTPPAPAARPAAPSPPS